MKALYKVILFLVMFHMTVIIVNSLDVFDNTFYSDVDEPEGNNLWDKAAYYLTPKDNKYFDNVGVTALVGLFVVGGIASGFISKSPIYPSMVFIIYLSFNMVLKSYGFFQKMFTNWDNQTLTYLGVAIGIGLVIIVIITVVETPTHGRSG